MLSYGIIVITYPPYLEGRNLWDTVLSENPSLPVIFLEARNQDVVELIESGLHDFARLTPLWDEMRGEAHRYARKRTLTISFFSFLMARISVFDLSLGLFLPGPCYGLL